MLPVITAFYASLAALLIIGLALRVVKFRRKFKVGIGGGDQPQLDGAIRAHANALENIPMALLLMAGAEVQGLHVIALHLAGIVLIVSRFLHSHGLNSSLGVSFGRYYGTLSCWLVIIALAVTNIILYFLSLI